MKTTIIPVFIPHLGCHHLCVFCNQKKISGSMGAPTAEEIKNTTKQFCDADISKVYEMAFYGGSFTALPLDLQTYYLEIAASLKKEKKIKKIRFSTRPDAITPEILTLAKQYGVDTIELGVQSLDEEVLRLSERGHGVYEVTNASALIRSYGFSLGLQFMPGLPGDNAEKIKATVHKMITLAPDFVRIYPTIIIKGTKLAELYEQGHYKPFSLETMVRMAADAYLSFTAHNIAVIRIGLQASDNLTEEKDLVAGPYHPAFGEMVISRIFRDLIADCLDHHQEESITIKVNSRNVSKVIGQKKENIQWLQAIKKITIRIEQTDTLGDQDLVMVFGNKEERRTLRQFARQIDTQS